ncbi:hypothetical protein [Streptomyces sp. YGL11-2]|uniref:hypothetical protein n=1 Tax=Streptomyces sp. YGL11-2 TaxID=3414028 RepID=UPI003CEB5BF1
MTRLVDAPTGRVGGRCTADENADKVHDAVDKAVGLINEDQGGDDWGRGGGD